MIRTLILSGANNHDWARSTPFCKNVLEASGRFSVDVTTNPTEVLEDKAKLATYQLLFLDYFGPAWSEAAQANFLDAVRGGTGVTILHAANNGFPGWVEFEKLCALCWREGTGHGRFHSFDVKVLDKNHPVTRGVSDLKAHPDELYHKLVHMHGAPYHVLASAYSDPATGGTGQNEPMLVVKTYGKGRVFHDILGHVWAGGDMTALEDPQFQTTLLRGCEWAATGNVAD
ncbi:ThuA domain-containing protein [Candidatus Poribacteria bacterium]|nr:ThuA domain-containing protein [Candidatus Poribacteria bacterium]